MPGAVRFFRIGFRRLIGAPRRSSSDRLQRAEAANATNFVAAHLDFGKESPPIAS
jgi:hypothetical protein